MEKFYDDYGNIINMVTGVEYYTTSKKVKGITDSDKQILRGMKYYGIMNWKEKLKFLWWLHKLRGGGGE